MGIKTQLFIKCISIFTALTTSSVSCFSTPSVTKEVNNEVLAIQLEQAANVAVINSNLLAESGQTILINGKFSEKTIPITISCENVNFLKDAAPTAEITAVSSDESRMTVLLDKQEVVLDEKEQTAYLTIYRSDYIVSEEVNERTTEEIPEVEVVENEISTEEKLPAEENILVEEPTNEPIYCLPSMEEFEGDKEPGILELPVIITGISNSADTTDNTINNTEETPKEETEPILPENGENFTEEGTPEEPPTDGETVIPGTEENPENQEKPGESIPEDQEKPEENIPEDQEKEEELPKNEKEPEEAEIPLTVGVALTLGEKTFSATFIVDESDTDENAAGELQYCPSQYHSTGPLKLINNQDTDTIVGDFPAMTKYTIGESSCILYDGGKVRVPAGETLNLDLSDTNVEADLEFCSFAGTAYNIEYVEIPHELNNTTMIIVDGSEKTIPVSYQWGKIVPVITVEHLTAGKNGLNWNVAEDITCKDDGKGKIQILPNESDAGTYRIKVLWIEKEITLYQLELPFYIQYGSGDQGGTDQ